MGVEARIVVYAATRAEAEAAANAAYARIDDVEQALSDYRPTSEAMGLCARAGTGESTGVSGTLGEALRRSRAMRLATGGAFDEGLGRITRLWREARRKGELPGAAEVREALAHSGGRHVRFLGGISDGEGGSLAAPGGDGGRVVIDREGLVLDFGGIGKGYAADAAREELARHGLERCMVALAGDVSVGEAPPGKRGWRVCAQRGLHGVEEGGTHREHPGASGLGAGAAGGVAGDSEGCGEFARCGVSTSGDTSQFVEVDGVRYSHIIDPRTGIGLRVRTAATVVARDAATADAAATALCVLAAWAESGDIHSITGFLEEHRRAGEEDPWRGDAVCVVDVVTSADGTGGREQIRTARFTMAGRGAGSGGDAGSGGVGGAAAGGSGERRND